MQYLSFYSSFGLPYDNVRHRQTLEYISLFLDEVTPFKFKNNSRIILDSKFEEFKKIEAQQKEKIRYSSNEFLHLAS